jgi:hypothetical protein
MNFEKMVFCAVAVLGLLETMERQARGQSPGVARRGAPTVSSRGKTGLSPDAAALYDYLKLQRPGELNWQRIPWLSDLAEAIGVAKAENRPLLLWVAGDDPLERC